MSTNPGDIRWEKEVKPDEIKLPTRRRMKSLRTLKDVTAVVPWKDAGHLQGLAVILLMMIQSGVIERELAKAGLQRDLYLGWVYEGGEGKHFDYIQVQVLERGAVCVLSPKDMPPTYTLTIEPTDG
jgi:hypothetical protein